MTQPAETPDEEAPGVDPGKLRKVPLSDFLIRFAFGAAVSAVAGGVTLLQGPRIGGLFLAFPAILPATLTLLEKRDGLAQAASDTRGASLGALGMAAFALAGAALMVRNSAFALTVALLAWVLVSGGLYTLLRLLSKAIGERQYLPEIPTAEAQPAIDALRAQGITLALAESCTGGTIAALLTSVPGVGEVLRGGFVTWADDSTSECLGIDPAIIARHGAVSPEVAGEMARGAKSALGADVGMAITGVEGKSTDGRPPGLTYISVATPDGRTVTRRYNHDHGSGRNRERDVRMALAALREVLEGDSSDTGDDWATGRSDSNEFGLGTAGLEPVTPGS